MKSTGFDNAKQHTYFKQNTRVVNHMNYIYLHNPDMCLKQKCSFLVVVISGYWNIKRRQTLRETWGSKTLRANGRNIQCILFLLGTSKKTKLPSNLLETSRETDQHHDIILVEMEDTYSNLVLKSLIMLHWYTNFCSTAEYLLKIDDDVLAILDPLYRWVMNAISNNTNKPIPQNEHLLVGKRILSDPVIRHGKYSQPVHSYPFKVYPPRLCGGAYLMSRKTAHTLLQTARFVPLIRGEDVYITGVLAKVANLSVTDSHAFDLFFGSTILLKSNFDPCALMKSGILFAHFPTRFDYVTFKSKWQNLLNCSNSLSGYPFSLLNTKKTSKV